MEALDGTYRVVVCNAAHLLVVLTQLELRKTLRVQPGAKARDGQRQHKPKKRLHKRRKQADPIFAGFLHTAGARSGATYFPFFGKSLALSSFDKSVSKELIVMMNALLSASKARMFCMTSPV